MKTDMESGYMVKHKSQPSHHTMKLLRWAILFPIAVTSAGGHSHGPFSCGSPDATDVELSLQSQALGIFQARLAESSNMDKEIPVCFHVVTDNNGGGEVSDCQLQDALVALNQGYGPNSCCDTSLDWCNEGDCSVDTGFSFTMAGIDENGNYVSGITYENVTTQGACVTRTLNSGWSNVIQTDDGVMKNALHKGDPRKVMNVYWVNRVVETSGKSVLAYATLPFFNVGTIDGVVIIAALAPNGGATGLDSGDVLIHEVGYVITKKSSVYCDDIASSDRLSFLSKSLAWFAAYLCWRVLYLGWHPRYSTTSRTELWMRQSTFNRYMSGWWI